MSYRKIGISQFNHVNIVTEYNFSRLYQILFEVEFILYFANEYQTKTMTSSEVRLLEPR